MGACNSLLALCLPVFLHIWKWHTATCQAHHNPLLWPEGYRLALEGALLREVFEARAASWGPEWVSVWARVSPIGLVRFLRLSERDLEENWYHRSLVDHALVKPSYVSSTWLKFGRKHTNIWPKPCPSSHKLPKSS